MKINIVIGSILRPWVVDDQNIEHEWALLLEDENQNHRVVLGLNRDDKLSKPYEPFFHRTLDLNRIIYLRDELTKLINNCEKVE